MKRALFIIVFGIIVVIIWSLYSSPHVSDVAHTRTATVTTTSQKSKLVSLDDVYRHGTHTIKGALITPTPCYTVDAKTSIVPSTTPQVIRLVLLVPPDTGRCLQLSATTTFSVKQKAHKDAVVSTYLNGVLIATSTAL